MSWNTIFYGSFNENVNHDRIDIWIKQQGFTGEPSALLLDANPLVITYAAKQFNDQLFGCGCEINAINQTGDYYQYDTLFSAPERNNYVEIIKTPVSGDPSIFIFQGYTLPEMYSTTLQKSIKLTITATDQLSQLDRFKPKLLVDDASYRADEFVNATDLIQTILTDCDVTENVAVNNTLFNQNYSKVPESTVFDNLFFDANQFSDKDGVMNDDEILEQILKTFYSRIYYANNKWMIERIPDIATLNKEYTLYVYDDASSFTVGNAPVDLKNHEVLSGTPELTYNPGYQKIRVKLNYKQPDSLVDNYYNDWQYYTRDYSVNTTKPIPRLRHWMFSSGDNSIYADLYNDQNIDTGLTWSLDSNWAPIVWSDWTWLQGTYCTTMFQFSTNTLPEKTILKVVYEHAVDPANATTGDTFKGRFALRCCTSTGTNYWISKSNANDSSTYWGTTPYIFEVEEDYDSFSDTGIFEVSKQIDVTTPVTSNSAISYRTKKSYTVQILPFPWVYTHRRTETIVTPIPVQYINEFYLDIYAMQRQTTWSGHSGEFQAVKTQFGNVDVDVATRIPPNILESSLGGYTGVKELSLDIFDVSVSQFTNGIYNQGDDETYRHVWKWSSDMLYPYIKIQEQYLQDMAQMYHRPRYTLNVDVRSTDSSVWTLGTIFQHSDIQYRDTSIMKFLCNGLAYNTKENSYRLNLIEFKADDGLRLDPCTLTPGFSVNPTSIDTGWTAGGLDINVSTNVTYTYNSSDNWITVSKYGSTVTATVTANVGDGRDGSVYFYPSNGLPVTVVPIHQDSSVNGTIEFDDSGNLVFDLGPNQVIDISILLFARAQVDSYWGYYRDTYANLDLYVNGTGVDAVYASAGCTTSCTDTDSHVFSVKGLSDASTLYGQGMLGNYQMDQEADLYPSVYLEITNVEVVSGGGTVTVPYSRWDYYYDQYGSPVGQKSVG
jgi:hypothetical protein